MKKFNALFLFILLVAGFNNVSAQKEFNEGTITIGITDLQVDDPQAAAMLNMVKTSTISIAFNEKKSLVTANMMSGMVQSRTVIDNNTKASTTLLDMMGQKSKTTITEADVKKLEKEANASKEEMPKELDLDYDVTYNKKDTKKILGYDCFRADIKVSPKDAKEGQVVNMVVYVAESIKFPKSLINGVNESMAQFGTKFDLSEIPLEISVNMANPEDPSKKVSITLAATEISQTVDAKTFELDDTGYEEKSMEELMKSSGM